MATLRILTDEARRGLTALAKVSQGVSKLLRTVLERIENQPGSFESLEAVPEPIVSRADVRLRKAKVVHQKHNYRILFFHFTDEDKSEHVDIFSVFERQPGYNIDWDWIRSLVEDQPN
jgi:hypothetical protein